MKAEILTIGDEILIGQIVNTNSVWIAQQLNLLGINVTHMASVSDEQQAIVNAFDAALTRADVVFITGGLGPTKDDITKKVMARYFNAELVLDEDVLKDVSSFFIKRGREVGELNSRQALVPKGCAVIRNPNGTAPGMWLTKNKTIFISMPGVPYEMKAMMTDSILPKLKSQFQLPFIYHKTVLTQGIGESNLAELIETWEDGLVKKNIKLAYLPQPGMVRLRLSSTGDDEHVLRITIDDAIDELKKQIDQYIYGYELYGEETPGLEKIVTQLLQQKNETIALAESCTGGYVSSLFTGIAGVSSVFRGSIVPYNNEMKQTLLNIDSSILETEGAVSKACVLAMAQQTLKVFNSDYALSISGIAGPGGGTEQKPVGYVWVAVASKTRQLAMQFQFGDNRQRNIVMTGQTALNLLRKFIIKHQKAKL
jgi:nicotinamide-nucleotide amidase